jgi:hypothetical protein
MALKLSLDSNSSVSTVVHDVYAKSNKIKDERLICEKMPQKTAVTWSSLLAGQMYNGLYRAQGEGVLLADVIFSAILSTCASLALLIEGQRLHAIIARTATEHFSYLNLTMVETIFGIPIQ